MTDPFVWSELSWVDFLVPTTAAVTAFLAVLMAATFYKWHHWLEKEAAPRTPSFFMPPWLVVGLLHFLVLLAGAVGAFLVGKEYYNDSQLGGEAGNVPATWPLPSFPIAWQYNAGAVDGIYFNTANHRDQYFTAGMATWFAALVLSTMWFFALYAAGAVRTSFVLITLSLLCAGNTVWTFWIIDLAAGITFIAVPAWFFYLWWCNAFWWGYLTNDVSKPEPVNHEEVGGYAMGYSSIADIPPPPPAAAHMSNSSASAAPPGYTAARGIMIQ